MPGAPREECAIARHGLTPAALPFARHPNSIAFSGANPARHKMIGAAQQTRTPVRVCCMSDCDYIVAGLSVFVPGLMALCCLALASISSTFARSG